MEINITEFVKNQDAYDFSGSVAERGENAAKDTWNNAVKLGTNEPILNTPEQLEALRDQVKGFGAWTDEQIEAWSDAECNALFIQLISGDMRESGMDSVDIEDFNWEKYERDSSAGHIAGNIFKSDDGSIYYTLSN